MPNKFVVWFNEVDKEDVDMVGGKGANTGEMVKANFPVPPGFIVTAHSYFHLLEKSSLKQKIKKYLENLDVDNPLDLKSASGKIKKEILRTPIPKEVAKEIINFYGSLNKKISQDLKNPIAKVRSLITDALVAVRSSATAEDLPNASFAGQQETYLNIKGESNVVEAVRKCWASLFEERAIYYRHQNKFDHLKLGIAVLVQKMVESETSGIMFTIDPTTNDKGKIVIEGIYGLGEMIVQGALTPDHYEVAKHSLDIIKKEIASQKVCLVKKGSQNIEINVKPSLQNKQKITNKQIVELAKLGKKLENHYFFPQDIEWAIEDEKIYLVQTRPITTIAETNKNMGNNINKNSLSKLPLLLEGSPASPGIAIGIAKILKSPREMNKIENGNFLIAPQTNPDYVPAMKRAGAIITDKGGRTSHAAIVSRELGIPCVVGTEKATKIIKDGMLLTIDADNGKIYKGSPSLESRKIIFNSNSTKAVLKPGTLKTATKIYVNLGEPEMAEKISQRDADGVGLLRAEFMIADIGIHPKKLIHDGKSNIFIDNLSQQIAQICKCFNPRPVVYRATDFKTNEYRNLKGGNLYEPVEPNPMLGYRGAFRYISDPQVFKLEIEAVKRVRNKYGYKNLHLMIPFVRTVREMIEVKKLLAGYEIMRSPSFKLWMMVEIPSNIILLDKFIDAGIDGISIGSNDLTMLILGTDRDNNEVAPVFDERNEAVLWALEKAIKTCHKRKITSSICGQAPSDYPDLVDKLVEWGVTSVSVNPDMIEKTREEVYRSEEKLIKKK